MKKFIHALCSPWIILPCILLLCLGIRLLYLHETYYPNLLPDTGNYYDFALRLLNENFIFYFFNPSRTPIYPLVIGTVMWITGNIHAPLYTASSYQGLGILVYIQTALGLLGIILLYLSMRDIGIRRIWSYLFSLFIGTNIMLFWQERAILTESITTFILITMTFFFIRILKKPTWKKFLGLFFIFTLAFLIRPNYVLLPFVLLPIIMMYHRKFWVSRLTMITMVAYAFVPGSYVYENAVLHGYVGITHIADINVLGRILRNNILVGSGGTVPYFYARVLDYRARGLDTSMPYMFLSNYDMMIYDNTQRLNELQTFTRKVIVGAFPQYAASVIRDVPNALLDVPDDSLLGLITIKSPVIHSLFIGIAAFYQFIQYITFALFLFLPVTLISFFKRRKFEFAVLTFLGILSLYQIFVMLFYGYGDWGRLVGAGQPVFYLFSFYWLGRVISTIHLGKRPKKNL